MRHRSDSRRPICRVVAVLAAIAAAAAPRPALADDGPALASLAGARYVAAATVQAACPVCHSPRQSHHAERVALLDGRYLLENVDQAHCPRCRVTILEVPETQRTRRLVSRLRRFVPATRDSIGESLGTYTLALSTPADRPFIREVRTLRRQDGRVLLVVD